MSVNSSVDVSATDIVLMSLATRDYHPVHHDASVAQALGHPALFLNAPSAAAMAERFLLQAWPEAARVKALRLKLGKPHHAGSSLSYSGELVSRSGQMLEVRFEARNALGVHASGSATLVLP